MSGSGVVLRLIIYHFLCKPEGPFVFTYVRHHSKILIYTFTFSDYPFLTTPDDS